MIYFEATIVPVYYFWIKFHSQRSPRHLHTMFHFFYTSISSEIPYVFEVPTTLDAFNAMIGNYAKTGKDVSLIVQRIHKANSVRLDRRNSEKMQNFYDVLLRRFVAVGDAIYTNGDGGNELDRYGQLDSITQTLYAMAQESPDIAGAVWNRRLGLFQKAYTKRLRDFGMTATSDDEDFSAWPTTGVILLLRALGHVFPVTDKRHYVVTPTILFLGQMLGHTPIVSIHDLVMGTICCGLLLEYTKEAKRIVPEAHAFLASVIRLYAWNSGERQGTYPLPTFQAASKADALTTLRASLLSFPDANLDTLPQISFESAVINSAQTPAAILYAALHMVESSIQNLSGSIESTEKEVFTKIVNSLLVLQKTDSKATTTDALPPVLKAKAAAVVSMLTSCSSISGFNKRTPLQRRSGMVQDQAIVTLAPRIENPDRYSVTQKDRNKTATQAAADRTRREYKREHKAVSRELRLDASMIETERRQVQDQKDSAAKAKRQRAFAWLESEQASMNQQVRQGGGLLQGGGTGAAKAKARTAKLGIKKGGKLR
jgi:nucleolar protein 14